MSLPNATTFQSLGGIKSNYGGTQNYNPDTDITAEENNEAFSYISGLSRMAPAAVVAVLGASPTIQDWESNWKEWDTTAPSITHNGTGDYTVSFPETVLNYLGVATPVSHRFCLAMFDTTATNNPTVQFNQIEVFQWQIKTYQNGSLHEFTGALLNLVFFR